MDTANAFKSLIPSAIDDMQIDLSGLTVLTEAASEYFACTALTAALAGADHVYAITKDSRYGSAEDVITYNKQLSKFFGVEKKITYSNNAPHKFAAQAQIVTNLGFLRPINKELIGLLPDDASIPLMWESWELRETDIDLKATKEKGIPIAGTKEDHPRLKTMNHLADVAKKLIEESDNSLEKNIAVIGSYPFGKAIANGLNKAGARADLNPSDYTNHSLIVIAENIKSDIAIEINALSKETVLIHIAGHLDYEAIKRKGVKKHPDLEVPPHHMTVTTAYAGPKPVVDLHAAGLKVGEILSRSMRLDKDPENAVRKAVESGYGCALYSRKPEDYKLD